MAKFIGFALCLIYLTYGDASTPVQTEFYLSKLQATLLTGYDKKQRPVKNINETTVVQFGLSLNTQYLDDQTQTMFFNAWLALVWKDEFLIWNPREFGNVTRIHMSPDDIWTPDLVLFNSKGPLPVVLPWDIPLIVARSGQVIWFPPFSGEVSCQMNLYKWPSDSHTCKFHFSSWSHYGAKVDLQEIEHNTTGEGMMLDNYERNNQWDLTNVESTRNVITLDQEYVSITFELSVRRMSAKLVSIIVSSTLGLTVVVMLSYCLPLHFHLSRIIFHMVSLFLFTVSLVSLILFLPPLGEIVPVIVNYYSAILILTTCSLLITLVLSNGWIVSYIIRPCSTQNVSKTIVKLMSSAPVLQKIIQTEIAYRTLEPELLNESEISSMDIASNDLSCQAIGVLRILNFIAGVIFAVSYMTIHYNMKSEIL